MNTTTPSADHALSVREVCGRFNVREHLVLAWIRSGELRALDVSRTRGGKPRWRITPEALAEFELRRTAEPPPKRTRRRRKQLDVIEFYKL